MTEKISQHPKISSISKEVFKEFLIVKFRTCAQRFDDLKIDYTKPDVQTYP